LKEKIAYHQIWHTICQQCQLFMYKILKYLVEGNKSYFQISKIRLKCMSKSILIHMLYSEKGLKCRIFLNDAKSFSFLTLFVLILYFQGFVHLNYSYNYNLQPFLKKIVSFYSFVNNKKGTILSLNWLVFSKMVNYFKIPRPNILKFWEIIYKDMLKSNI